ncbi:MAG: hypothetical protein H0V70_00325 [Ktedonobacteraceae bacterium]|nr:hypothetical protein [Ktedonobacteraceae bacterium]
MPVSYCSGCKRTFSSTSAFDLHRVGNFAHNQRRCLVSQEMSARGMMRNEKGQWTLPPTEEVAPWYVSLEKVVVEI